MSLYRHAHSGGGGSAMDDLGYWYEVEGGGDRWRAIPGTDDYELASSAGTPLDLAGIGALGLTLRNRLNHVTDNKGVAFTNDLGNQSPDNYAGTCPEGARRDAIGELVSDAAEGLEVDWTAYHKVANVHYPSARLRAGHRRDGHADAGHRFPLRADAAPRGEDDARRGQQPDEIDVLCA